jgi:hypothetical protein
MRLVVDARTSAFAALVDYAGVFPPASLTVHEAVDGYRSARASSESWVAGRFLIRASQLAELGQVAMATMSRGEDPWEVSVVFDVDPAVAAALAADFDAEMDPAMTVSAAEAPIQDPSPKGIENLFTTVSSINPTVVPFLEVTRTADVPTQITSIKEAGTRAHRTAGTKLRCGGVTADLFPTPTEVTDFILAAVNASVPFKATAGLHQPFRHFDQNLGVHRHGFINLLMATTAAAHGADEDTIEAIVAETDADAFSVSPAFARWNHLSFPGSAIRRTRVSQFVAYGSCDFDEPVEALIDLGMLGEGS